MDDLKKQSLELHERSKGKLAVSSKVPLETREDLTLAYTPGVAEPCRAIAADPAAVYRFTSKGNMVGVVTDGSAVLGLGNIGPAASLPVMEGKAILFKRFAGVDAFPIALATQEADKIVDAIKLIEPVFGGINLEDIAAPKCFDVEERLKKELSIPVFHDDQHGTAIVILAALRNALKLVKKDLAEVKIVINGAGAAGMATSKLLLLAGVRHLTSCDSVGILYEGREKMNPYKDALARKVNPAKRHGSLADAMAGADVFIGVSKGNLVTKEMIATMADRAAVFAMANPSPEILPQEAKAAGAEIVATGRSDYPNQINNVLAFPGVFRGVLDVRARQINDEMKMAASDAISGLVSPADLQAGTIIPNPFNPKVAPAVAAAVAAAAKETRAA